MKLRLSIIFILCACLAYQISAQTRQTWTEEEMSLQAKYIEANKQKLLGNIDEALTLYNEVLKEKKDLHPAWYEKARMLHVNERDQDAIIAIDKAIKLDPSNQWYTLFKSDLYERSDQLGMAAEVLQGFVQKGYGSKSIIEELISLLIRSQQYESAIQHIEKLEENYGATIDKSKRKYSLYTKIGNGDKATKELENMVKLSPHNIEVLHLLAVHYSKQNEDKKAEKLYNKILQIDPNDTRASIAMAQTFREEGESTSFVRSIHSIISNPNLDIDVKIQELIPHLEKLVNSYTPSLSEELIKSGKLLQKTHTNNAKASAFMADVYFHSGQFGLAKDQYEATLKLKKNIYPVWEQYMYTLYNLNDFNTLIASSESALDLYPNKGQIHYFSGLALGIMGDLDNATSALKHGLIISKKNRLLQSEIKALLATINYKNKKFNKSQNLIKNELSKNELSKNELSKNELSKNENSHDNFYRSLIEYNYLLNINNPEINGYYHKIGTKESPYSHYIGAISYFINNDLPQSKYFINMSLEKSLILIPRAMDLYTMIYESSPDETPDKYNAYISRLKSMGYTRLESIN